MSAGVWGGGAYPCMKTDSRTLDTKQKPCGSGYKEHAVCSAGTAKLELKSLLKQCYMRVDRPLVMPARCQEVSSLHDNSRIWSCGGGSRHYTMSPNNPDFQGSHTYCASLGTRLVKWDTLEKYLDIVDITGLGNSSRRRCVRIDELAFISKLTSAPLKLLYITRTQ